MIDKPRNREILQSHYLHKAAKLRLQLETEHEEKRKLAKETVKLEKENQDNFVFSLADRSFPVSECDLAERVTVETPPTY